MRSSKKWKILASHWTIKLGIQTAGGPQQKLPKFGFRTHTTALWPVEQSSILSDKVWLSSGPPELFTFRYCAWFCKNKKKTGLFTEYFGSFTFE